MLATIYAHEFPELKDFQQADGTLLMRLDKALYGTLIAGKLWYDKLTRVRVRVRFSPNPLDPSVFNNIVEGKQITDVVFVDHILAICEKESTLEWFIGELWSTFAEVKGCVRDDFSYLGMHMHNKRDKKVIEVSMKGYHGCAHDTSSS